MDTKTKTFFQSKLIPATVVFFKWKDETETEKYINEETKAKAQKREKSHIEFPPLPKCIFLFIFMFMLSYVLLRYYY